MRYGDHQELIAASDLYYVAPGHIVLVEQDCDLVEVTRLADWRRTAASLAGGSGKCFVESATETNSKEMT